MQNAIDIDHTLSLTNDIRTKLASVFTFGTNTVLTDNLGDTVTFLTITKASLVLTISI